MMSEEKNKDVLQIVKWMKTKTRVGPSAHAGSGCGGWLLLICYYFCIQGGDSLNYDGQTHGHAIG